MGTSRGGVSGSEQSGTVLAQDNQARPGHTSFTQGLCNANWASQVLYL